MENHILESLNRLINQAKDLAETNKGLRDDLDKITSKVFEIAEQVQYISNALKSKKILN